MSVKFIWSGLSAAAAWLAASAGAAAAPAPAEARDPVLMSRAELLGKVAKTTDGLATSPLPTGPNAVAIQVRREKSGEVEIHDAKEDILIAQTGRATVIVGPATGTKSTAPGEWRGGAIKESRRYDLAPGDVLWIPAGLPHQMLLPAGKSFHYLALKFDAKAP